MHPNGRFALPIILRFCGFGSFGYFAPVFATRLAAFWLVVRADLFPPLCLVDALGVLKPKAFPKVPVSVVESRLAQHCQLGLA